MVDETYNAAERSHVKQAAKAAKQADRESKEFIINAMATRQGRGWIHARLMACHCFSTSFDGNALRMAFAEGERNVGNQILAEVVRHCPDQYVLMMRESNARDYAVTANLPAPREPDSTGDQAGAGGAEPPDRFVDRDEASGGWNLATPADIRRAETELAQRRAKGTPEA